MPELILESNPYAVRNYPLDGTIYNILTRWNGREAAWYLDILTQGGSPLITGLKVLPYVSLLRPYADPRLPPSVLMAVNLDGSGERPTRGGLGSETRLYYLDSADIAYLQDLVESAA